MPSLGLSRSVFAFVGLMVFASAYFGTGSSASGQQVLVADLSDHRIGISTGFTGAEVMLFGAIEGEGEIVVVVTGPRETVTVRRKSRIAGIWANTASQSFENVPAFYAVASTAPLEDVAPSDVRGRQQIGLDNIAMRASESSRQTDDEEVQRFRDGLVRNRIADGLFIAESAPVTVLSDRLFHTRITFPANVTTGLYSVAVYYMRDGNAVNAQTTPLLVEKTGLGAEVFLFAHRQSAVYGLFAILIAVAAGWLAAWIFRKV